MITFDEKSRVFKLDTAGSSYVLEITQQNYVRHLYYGARVSDTALGYLQQRSGNASFSASPASGGPSLDSCYSEYSCNGTGDCRISALQIRGKNGSAATDIRYEGYSITNGKPGIPGQPATYAQDGDGTSTLELYCRDSLTNIRVTLRYSVFEHEDAIARSVTLVNEGGAPADVERVYSSCIDLADCDYDMVTLYGAWAKERQLCRRPLGHGIQSVGSKRGSSSNNHNPFMALIKKGTTEDNGEAFGFSLVYSGNWEIACEVDTFGTSRVLCGINPTDFRWKLCPGERFDTPELVCVRSGEGVGGMSRRFHRLYREKLCRGPWKSVRRPILVNNWEATYFNFDDDKLVSIAKDAAELGIEMLVMDDGWFGKRSDDRSSLGDWYVNCDKLKGGLKPLVERVNALGVKFGIWFEPEMISPDSDLYRAHHDWALHVDGREMSIGRSQYVLDMTRADVRDYLFGRMSDVLSSANIEYVKWDFNRNLTEAGSALLPPDRAPEIFHRYVLGLYELLERLLTAFPNLLLEGCSGGGARYDPAMLYYSPQYWTSDNTDAIDRCFIQWGTSYVYPAVSMSAHVSASPNHQTGRRTSFSIRGDVAMGGAFGYELDLNALSDDERGEVREQVESYKRWHDTVCGGDYYRILDPFEDDTRCAWEYAAPDGSEAIMTLVIIRADKHVRYTLRPRGLDADATYKVTRARDPRFALTLRGDTLMNAGIVAGGFRDHDSFVYHIEKVG